MRPTESSRRKAASTSDTPRSMLRRRSISPPTDAGTATLRPTKRKTRLRRKRRIRNKSRRKTNRTTSHQEAAPHGAIEGSVALENDFTKVSIFKVDRDAYQNMNRNQTKESEHCARLQMYVTRCWKEENSSSSTKRASPSLAPREFLDGPPRRKNRRHRPASFPERNIQSSNTKRRADTGGQKTRRHFASKTRTKYRSLSSKTKRSLRRRLRKRPIGDRLLRQFRECWPQGAPHIFGMREEGPLWKRGRRQTRLRVRPAMVRMRHARSTIEHAP